MSNKLIAVALVVCSTYAFAGERLSTAPPRELAEATSTAPTTAAPTAAPSTTAAPKKKSKPLSATLGTSSAPSKAALGGLGTRGTGVVRGTGSGTGTGTAKPSESPSTDGN